MNDLEMRIDDAVFELVNDFMVRDRMHDHKISREEIINYIATDSKDSVDIITGMFRNKLIKHRNVIMMQHLCKIAGEC